MKTGFSLQLKVSIDRYLNIKSNQPVLFYHWKQKFTSKHEILVTGEVGKIMKGVIFLSQTSFTDRQLSTKSNIMTHILSLQK